MDFPDSKVPLWNWELSSNQLQLLPVPSCVTCGFGTTQTLSTTSWWHELSWVMFVHGPCMKFMVLISWDERGSPAEEDSSWSRKCHFSVIVYDSSLHLWLNNEGWQLKRATGGGIKGLRFPLGRVRARLNVLPANWIQMLGFVLLLLPHNRLFLAASELASKSHGPSACKHDRRLTWREAGTEALL